MNQIISNPGCLQGHPLSYRHLSDTTVCRSLNVLDKFDNSNCIGYMFENILNIYEYNNADSIEVTLCQTCFSIKITMFIDLVYYSSW